MKNLFDAADQYAKESIWKDFALLKCCLCAMGIVIGASVPAKHKPVLTSIAAGAVVATYIPLMTKFCKIAFQREEAE